MISIGTCSDVTAIIVAAGTGSRISLPVPKQFYKLSGKPILAYTIEKFERSSAIDTIVLVTGKDSIDYCRKEIIEKYAFSKICAVVPGGSNRQESVYQGLMAAGSPEIVLIHDGVRPFVSDQNINDIISETRKSDCCVLGVRAKDTVKICSPDLIIRETPGRDTLWLAQTPQGFRYELLLEAHEFAIREALDSTDDAALVEHMGHKVRMVPGSYENIKITTGEDLLIGEWMIKESAILQ